LLRVAAGKERDVVSLDTCKKLAMRRCMTQMIHLLHNQNQRVKKPTKKEKVTASTSTPKNKRTKKEKVAANTSTPKNKRTKKQVITKVGASPSTPLKLLHAPSTPTSPFDLNCSPGALTRSRARRIAVEEAEVHGTMALDHLMNV